MRALLLAAVLALVGCAKSDCEKAAEAVCKNSSSKTYDNCYGTAMFRCAQKSS